MTGSFRMSSCAFRKRSKRVIYALRSDPVVRYMTIDKTSRWNGIEVSSKGV